jgi:hypothetical protein
MGRINPYVAAALIAAPTIAPIATMAATLQVGLAPEVSFDVPDGWTACDPTINQALTVPAVQKTKSLCRGFDNKGGAQMVASPDGSLVLSFASLDPSIFPPSYFQNSTSRSVSDQSANMCQSAFHLDAGKVPCVFELGTVSGRKAIVGHASTPNGEFEIGRVVFTSDDMRTVTFIFMAALPSAKAGDQMDEIVKSIRMPASAK